MLGPLPTIIGLLVIGWQMTFKHNNAPSILVMVLAFILLDSVALALNFWISAQLNQSAVAINLAGRQRMLSQRMTKSLLMLQVAGSEAQKLSAFQEFSDTVNLFDMTMTGFLQGGNTKAGDGKPLYLPANKAENSQNVLSSAGKLWQIMHQDFKPLLNSGMPINAEKLQPALQSALLYNTLLLNLMNDLTSVLEQNATQEVFYLRILQALLLLLALLNFIFVCKRLLGHIKLSHNNVQALRNIIDSIDTGIVLYSHEKVVRSANKAATQLFGYQDASLVGKHLGQLICNDNAKMLGVKRDGNTFVAKVNTQTLFEFSEEVSLCTVVDVSEQEDKEKELMRLAFHDVLTGLPNRALLMERLRQNILLAKRNEMLLAVLFVDLDGFKAVNDDLGHVAGDELLLFVSRRFQQCCRETDTLARIGGDEFVFIISSLRSAMVAQHIADNVLQALSPTFLIGGQAVSVGASIGIAMYPNDGDEAELLIKRADEAMYVAKGQGKNRYFSASTLPGLANSNPIGR